MKITLIKSRQLRGGPSSFRNIFEKGIINRGGEISWYSPIKRNKLIFLINGTRRFLELFIFKIIGSTIVQRLGPIPWEHKVYKTNIFKYSLAEIRKYIVVIIRLYIATDFIYQSKYTEKIWQDNFPLKKKKPSIIIYNGANNIFHNNQKNNRVFCNELVSCEGEITNFLSKYIFANNNYYKLNVFGQVSEKISNNTKIRNNKFVKFYGYTDKKFVSKVYKEKNFIFLSLELHPACPNSILESLAAGIPVIGFKTGSSEEIVTPDVGVIIDYDITKLISSNPTDFDKIMPMINNAVEKIKKSYQFYSNNAMLRYKKLYTSDIMLDNYNNFLKSKSR